MDALPSNVNYSLGDNNYVSIDFESVLRDYTPEFTMPLFFRDRKIMFEWVRKKGEEHGFVIVVGRSDNGSRNSSPRMTLVCDRWGKYKEKPISLSSQGTANLEILELGKKKKNRESGTKKCGCKFQLNARQVTVDGEWQLKVFCGFHNHPICESMLGHSYAGRLLKSEEEYVIELSHENSRPKDILHGLKEKFPENKSIIRTIYNARVKNRATEHAGRSQIQQLMFKLTDHAYHFEYRQCENTNVIKEKFFAHLKSIELMKAFPYVLFMDCTYKTNRYNLPLLEIVGVTSTKMTFLVAAVYLEAEKEGNYTWACEVLKSMMDQSCLPNVIVTDRELALMNAIRETFPTTTHLLCRWHINTNILAKCKKMFDMQEIWEAFILHWNVMVKADTEASFDDYLRRLSEDYSQYPDAVNYVLNQWIVPYKERFVSCWTNHVMHFDNLTTNRVESQHALLKKQLGSSQGAFETCWKQIHKLIECSHIAIIVSFEKSRTVVQHKFKSSLWSEVRGMVSINALDLIFNSLDSLYDGSRVPLLCGCAVRSACGLPCPHELAQFMQFNSPIPLDKVHAFWRKLDTLPIMSYDDDIEEEIRNRYNEIRNTLDLRFEAAPRTGKNLIVRRLTEICHPATTMANEPAVKKNNKGCPKAKSAKFLKSTKRDPSAFEYVEAIPDQVLFNTDANQGSLMLSAKAKLQPVRRKSQHAIKYLNQLPVFMHGYIEKTVDVRGDGNCGFRCIAELLGRDSNDWRWVREVLYQEVFGNQELYAELFMAEDRMDKVLSAIHWFDGPCGEENWFDSAEMGYAVANAFNVALVTLSNTLYLTFLPLRKSMPHNPKLICICYVNDNHYIHAKLKEGCPLPPVPYKWYDCRAECATGWLDFYQDRLIQVPETSTYVIDIK